MHNSAYKLLKHIKNAAAMGSGSFMPPEPLPNSVKANQIEQQELAEQQGAASAGAGNEQMMQMQKAQEDAVNELQQTKQQLAQMQGELQNVQAQSQQQQQAMQMSAQQEIQKAQMDAQYELQSEKIKNQQKLLSVQEKAMRTAGKAKPDQNHILSNQLKRVVRKVNSLKSASAPQAGMKATGMAAAKTLGRAVPFVGAAVSGGSAINNLRKGNYLSAGVDALGGLASFVPLIGTPLAVGSSFLSSALENKPQLPEQATPPTQYPDGAAATQQGDIGQLFSSGLQSTMGAPQQQQQQQRWDVGLSPSERFSVMNQAQAMNKSGYANYNPYAAGGPQLYRTTPPGFFGALKERMPPLPDNYNPMAAGGPQLYRKTPTLFNSPANQTGFDYRRYLGDGGLLMGQNAPNILGELKKRMPPLPDNYNPMAAGGPQLYRKTPTLFNSPANQTNAPDILSGVKYAKSGNEAPPTKGGILQQVEYPDIRKFMKNPPPPGEDIASPIPILQSGFQQEKFNMPQVKQQGYGPVGDFIKQLIFQVGFPMFGMRNPLHPDFSKVHGSLVNNEAYKVQPPNTFY
jgi:hypothetical protein